MTQPVKSRSKRGWLKIEKLKTLKNYTKPKDFKESSTSRDKLRNENKLKVAKAGWLAY